MIFGNSSFLEDFGGGPHNDGCERHRHTCRRHTWRQRPDWNARFPATEPGAFVQRSYTILTAAGGRNGTFDALVGVPPDFQTIPAPLPGST